MFTVTYTYTHPVNVLEAIAFTQEDLDFREGFIAYATLHGLLTTETRMIDATRIVHEVIWESIEDRDACTAHYGEPYTNWSHSVKQRLEAAGGTYVLSYSNS